MKNNAKELERAKYLTEAKRIFANAEDYTDTEVTVYAKLIENIFNIIGFDTIKDNDIIISGLKDSIQTLSPIEVATLVLRYGLEDGVYKSRDAVGQELGYKRERIRQFEVKALRKMRHPSRVVNFSVTQKNLQLKLEQERLATRVLLSQEAGGANLNISVRSYDCLMRAGITTVEQLLNTPDDEIIRIRGIGKRSYEELTSCKKAFSSK